MSHQTETRHRPTAASLLGTWLLAVFLTLLFLLAAPSTGDAQVVDSISVEVVGEPAAIVIDGPLRAYVNSEVVFRFQIIDADGAPSPGIAVWESDDTTRAAILAETDSTVTVRLLSKGRIVLRVFVERLDVMVIGGVYGEGSGSLQGRFQWASEGTFTVECKWDPATGDPCGSSALLHLCVLARGGSGNLWASDPACAEGALASSPLPLRQASYQPGPGKPSANVSIVARSDFRLPNLPVPDFLRIGGPRG